MVHEEETIITRNSAEEPLSLHGLATESDLSDSYEDILEVDISEFPQYKIITIKNTHENYGLYYCLYVSAIDDPESTDWCVKIGSGGVLNEQLLVANSITYQTFSEPWRRVKIECKNEVISQNSSVEVRIMAENEKRD